MSAYHFEDILINRGYNNLFFPIDIFGSAEVVYKVLPSPYLAPLGSLFP